MINKKFLAAVGLDEDGPYWLIQHKPNKRIPYGKEWEEEMMKLSKKELIALLRGEWEGGMNATNGQE